VPTLDKRIVTVVGFDDPKSSCIKQKLYDLNISESKQKIDMNFFSLAKAPRR
jgi:hypothetical protein